MAELPAEHSHAEFLKKEARGQRKFWFALILFFAVTIAVLNLLPSKLAGFCGLVLLLLALVSWTKVRARPSKN